MRRRHPNPQHTLKPQDLLVLLKLCTLKPLADPSYRQLAPEIGMTKSEVHAAMKRLQAAALLRELDGRLQPVRDAVKDFVVYGARYAFPPVRGEVTRGMVTGWGAPPLREKFRQEAEAAPVWPHPKGEARGPALYPLYPGAPDAAMQDAALYELLALFDALRNGRAREREMAKPMLLERLT